MIAISDLWSATQERVVENNKNRWDAGEGTTALSIIGTTLGGLATAMVGGNGTLIVNRQAAV